MQSKCAGRREGAGQGSAEVRRRAHAGWGGGGSEADRRTAPVAHRMAFCYTVASYRSTEEGTMRPMPPAQSSGSVCRRRNRSSRSGIWPVLLALALLGLGLPQPEPATAPLLAATAQPTPTLAPARTPTQAPRRPASPDAFFDEQRFSYAPDFYQPEIAAFLDGQPGPLKDMRFQVGDRSQSLAEIVVVASSLYSFNPKILLALLELQSGLLSTADPSPTRFDWALGFRGEGGSYRGLYRQINWGIVSLRRAIRDHTLGTQAGRLPDLIFADGERQTLPPDTGLARYVLAKVLARTTTPEDLDARLDGFQATYTRLFGDPRLPPVGWPPPTEPFLARPMEQPFRVTSFFDHNTPLLHQNGSVTSFWGVSEAALSYDGHTGWDYAMRPPDRVLAAAGGTVVFAGNSDDGCRTPARAVVIDHGNGYRTLYWHLDSLGVETGQVVAQGAVLGVAGDTGCSIGPHLHLQVQYLGRDIDPYGWCGSTPDPWASTPAGQASAWLWADMLNPCAAPPPDTIVVDDSDPGFASSGEWERSPLGYGGGAHFTATSYNYRGRPSWHVLPLFETPAVAIWQPDLPQAGRYRVVAYIPYVLNGMDDSLAVHYQVYHRNGVTETVVDTEATANSWADLGTYTFEPGPGATGLATPPRVRVSTLAGDHGRGLWVDAVAWIPE